LRPGLEAPEEARRVGPDTQLATIGTRRNMHHIDRLSGLAAKAGERMWSAYFLVRTGRRAAAEDDLTAGKYEEGFEKLYRISNSATFDV
jgi:MoaA/NifB/PqqE/SkfB family radical SAM enzyme